MSIVLENLNKRYDDQAVVNNVSLEVADGEFFVLLGSSGSGKTTILNLIAGLTALDRGRVLLHGRDVTDLPTRERRVGFVFQNYALFQYMTVGENVEFGLSIRKIPRAVMHRRRDEMLEMVGLTGLGDRMPAQLSGGQQQRVALARALAHNPDVLLLDEPLGALDARIRTGLRRSLHEIQRAMGVATILVTHDQEEAFDLADRIGVMSYGRLVEVGRPADLYQCPETEFVATFLGEANLLVGCKDSDGVRLGPVRLDPPVPRGEWDGKAPMDEQRIQLLIRPEDVTLAADEETLDCPALGAAEVETVAFGGSLERLKLRLPPIPGVRTIAPAVSYGEKNIRIEAVRPPESARRFPLNPGDRVWVGVRRFHALAHPGMNFLIVSDGTKPAEASLDLGGQLARLAHARVTLLWTGDPAASLGEYLGEARKRLGNGLESIETLNLPAPTAAAIAVAQERQPHDLVIVGRHLGEDPALIRGFIHAGAHHLLLIPGPQPVPATALICVAGGEPGKDDVLFAGRLARHLGTETTLLTVAQEGRPDGWFADRTARFLEGGVRSLEALGVRVRSLVRDGIPQEAIVREFYEGDYDLLVLGVPLAGRRGEVPLGNVVGNVVKRVTDKAILIVRSHFVDAPAFSGKRRARHLADRLQTHGHVRPALRALDPSGDGWPPGVELDAGDEDLR